MQRLFENCGHRLVPAVQLQPPLIACFAEGQFDTGLQGVVAQALQAEVEYRLEVGWRR
ncbi:hypothetical protein D3C86_2114020 [compost metagenome]